MRSAVPRMTGNTSFELSYCIIYCTDANFKAPIGSSFCLSNREASVVHSATKVCLQKILCVMDSITGSYSFEESNDVLQGQIRNVPFSKGTMKSVYNVCISLYYLIYNVANESLVWQFLTDDGHQFVVKRFFKLRKDDENNVITASAHNVQIQAEVGRLTLGKWFFDAFIKHCSNASVAIDDSA